MQTRMYSISLRKSLKEFPSWLNSPLLLETLELSAQSRLQILTCRPFSSNLLRLSLRLDFVDITFSFLFLLVSICKICLGDEVFGWSSLIISVILCTLKYVSTYIELKRTQNLRFTKLWLLEIHIVSNFCWWNWKEA